MPFDGNGVDDWDSLQSLLAMFLHTRIAISDGVWEVSMAFNL